MAATPDQSTTTVGTNGFVVLNFSYALASLTATDVLKDLVIPFPYKLVDIRMFPATVATTGSKAATLTAKIDGTAVTGAAVALTSTNMGTIGVGVTGTATDILSGGNNTGAAGSKITVTGSGVTAFVEGTGNLVITLQSQGE
jgi:hypothetical protein